MHKNTKPKLLHITSSLKMGGAERVLVDLIGALGGEYEHEVLFFHDGPHRANLERMGVVCRQISGLVVLYDLVFWFRMVCATRRVHPDCIHSMLWGANWVSRVLGKVLGVPVINGMHNSFDTYGTVRRLLDRSTLSWADYSVAVSDRVKSSCERVYPAVRVERVVVIENGVNLQCGAAQAVSRDELAIPVDAFVIGTVGRFELEKNQALLVRAFALIASQEPRAFLLLVGYGSQEGYLRDLAVQLGLETKIIFVIGKPAEAYYLLCDCFVLSSPREGLPIALLEAMANAVPCVVANLDGQQPPLTNGHNGVLTDSYEAPALARAIVGLMRAPDEARRMGTAGKELIEMSYTINRMAQSYRALFDRCIEKRQNVGASH